MRPGTCLLSAGVPALLRVAGAEVGDVIVLERPALAAGAAGTSTGAEVMLSRVLANNSTPRRLPTADERAAARDAAGRKGAVVSGYEGGLGGSLTFPGTLR